MLSDKAPTCEPTRNHLFMRIRLKMAPIDVATGQWEVFSPKPIQDTSASARYTRAASDQQQVAVLKARTYAELAQDIAKKYAE